MSIGQGAAVSMQVPPHPPAVTTSISGLGLCFEDDKSFFCALWLLFLLHPHPHLPSLLARPLEGGGRPLGPPSQESVINCILRVLPLKAFCDVRFSCGKFPYTVAFGWESMKEILAPGGGVPAISLGCHSNRLPGSPAHHQRGMGARKEPSQVSLCKR